MIVSDTNTAESRRKEEERLASAEPLTEEEKIDAEHGSSDMDDESLYSVTNFTV